MDKYYKIAIHLLKYRVNAKHNYEIKSYIHRCKLNDAQKAIVAERIFEHDRKCNEAVENLGVAINEKRYSSRVYDIISDVVGYNNELNLDDLEEMGVDLIKCTPDEYFKKEYMDN